MLTLFQILIKSHWKVFLGNKNVDLREKSKMLFSVVLGSIWLFGFCCTLNASEHLHQLQLTHLKEKALSLLEASYFAVHIPGGPQVTLTNHSEVVIDSS